MKDRISVPGRHGRWGWVPAVVAAALVSLACGALASGSRAAANTGAQAACGGRALLTCTEKKQVFPDTVNWSHAFVLDGELFETPLAGRIRTPALRQFWLFETATAAARAEYEFGLVSELADTNFEEVVRPPALPRPAVQAGGSVSRKLAAAMTGLMRAEQAEVVNLYALGVSMNRATEARYERGRQDWLKWQEWMAAGYARRTAGAISGVIHGQRLVSRYMRRARLLFGVGSADLNLARRNVRRSGLVRPLVNLLESFGFDPSLVSHAADFFRATSFGTLSFSLPEFLGQHAVIVAEQEFQSMLRHFAARVPAAQRPPS